MNKNSQEYVAFGFEKKRTPKFGGSVIAGSLKGRAAGHRREALSFLLLRLHSSASLFSSKQQMYCSSLVGRLESIKSRSWPRQVWSAAASKCLQPGWFVFVIGVSPNFRRLNSARSANDVPMTRLSMHQHHDHP
jgi:hypothetical protein